MKYAIIILAVAIGLVTCRKKEKPTMLITGSVTDKSTGSGVAGATVTIRYKPYKDGVFTTTFTSLTSTTTDGSGNYSFDIEKPNTSDFEFSVAATSYFGALKVINPDNLSTKNSNAQADLGTCYYYTRVFDKAVKNLSEALVNDPKNLNARYNLGIVYKSQGKFADAKKEWEIMRPLLKTDEEKKKLDTVIESLNKKAS